MTFSGENGKLWTPRNQRLVHPLLLQGVHYWRKMVRGSYSCARRYFGGYLRTFVFLPNSSCCWLFTGSRSVTVSMSIHMVIKSLWTLRGGITEASSRPSKNFRECWRRTGIIGMRLLSGVVNGMRLECMSPNICLHAIYWTLFYLLGGCWKISPRTTIHMNSILTNFRNDAI